eukprot:SAG31_NODE_2973_length_4832_cov_11.390882_3_plen_45_part_00
MGVSRSLVLNYLAPILNGLDAVKLPQVFQCLHTQSSIITMQTER